MSIVVIDRKRQTHLDLKDMLTVIQELDSNIEYVEFPIPRELRSAHVISATGARERPPRYTLNHCIRLFTALMIRQKNITRRRSMSLSTHLIPLEPHTRTIAPQNPLQLNTTIN